MVFYYHCYNDSVESLAKRINVKWLEYNIYSNIETENDIFLIHLILRINKDKGIYRQSELKQYIWGILSAICSEYISSNSNGKIENYQRGFYKLFDFCWKQKFSMYKDGKNAEPLYRIVYRKMPLKRRLLDSNISLIIYSILFVIFCILIDKWTIADCAYKWDFNTIETHPTAIALSVLAIVFTVLEDTQDSDKATTYGPAFCCLALFVFAIILAVFEPNSLLFNNDYQRFELSSDAIAKLEIHLIKRNVYLGLACLLLIPMLKFNFERLEDNFFYHNKKETIWN